MKRIVVKSKAQLLWDSICEYYDSTVTYGDHGNSGEFHDENEYQEIIKELRESRSKLISSFYKATGWLPTEVGDEEGWVLK